VVLDSNSELVSSDMLSVDKGSLASHLRSDLESHFVGKWLSWVSESSLVNVPSLVEAVVAVPEDNMSIVVVVSAVNVEALSTVVSNVSSRSSVPSESLVDLGSPWSDGSGNTNFVTLSLLVGNNVASSGEGSDSSSSRVEHEPLLVVPWGVVSNSESVLVSTNVLRPEESSSSWHE